MEANEHFTFSTEGNEVIVRRGEAEPIDPKEQFRLEGAITAPYEYIRKKLSVEEINKPEKSYLHVNRETGILELVLKEFNFYKRTIKGQLVKSTDLKKMRINEDSVYTPKDLRSHLRKFRYFFNDKPQHAKLMEDLSKFSANVNFYLKDHKDDTKGNVDFQIKKEIKSMASFDKSFMVTIPVYKGTKALTFRVDINIDLSAQAPQLFLISDDLYELEEQLKHDLIDGQIENITKIFDCSVIDS